MLKEGIKVLIEVPHNENDILSINSGIEIPENQNYISRTFIPKNTFRVLSDIETKIISLTKNDSDNLNYNDIIKLVKLPTYLQKHILKVNLNNIKSYEELEEAIKDNDEFRLLAEKLMVYIKSKSADPDIHNLGIQIEPGNEFTTTKEQNRYVGLHIDSWDKLSISERKKSKNRICFNLGKGSRYLYFINIPITKMNTELSYNKEMNIDNIVTNFLVNNTEYPILRLKIKPFEGYIAPTENIIHDGSTFGNTDTDITFTVRSIFF